MSEKKRDYHDNVTLVIVVIVGVIEIIRFILEFLR